MDPNRNLARAAAILVTLGLASQAPYFQTSAQSAQTARTVDVAVGPQYDSTHVDVGPTGFRSFRASVIATFGGTTAQRGVATVTPTPSSTRMQLVLTPVGTLSVFGFKTPIPYPFGSERTGYLVTDLDEAIRAAKATGADVLVAPFNDPIGRDAVIQWPGGVEHAIVLAHDCAVVSHAADGSGESGLCLIGQRECVRAQLSRLFSRTGPL